MIVAHFHCEWCADMTFIIQILLTLTYAALGDCHLALLTKQLLGLAPTVGPLLPHRTHTKINILKSILQGDYDHLRPLNQNGPQIYTYNADRNYNPLRPNFYSGFNPPELSPFNTAGYNTPFGLQRLDEGSEHIDQTLNLNDLHISIDDKESGEYPKHTLDGKTLLDYVASLATNEKVPKTDKDSNMESVPNNEYIHQIMLPGINKIKKTDHLKNGEIVEGLNAGKILLVKVIGNNIYLLQDTDTPNTKT